MYSITLSDGKKLNNLRLNGNNFIANYPITEETFKFNLSTIDIISDSVDDDPYMLGYSLGKHNNMMLVSLQHGLDYMNEGEYWFTLSPIPEDQMRYDQLKADIEYLAMMTDTEM